MEPDITSLKKRPFITVYGIYLAVAIPIVIICLLCMLKIDDIPLIKLMFNYYFKKNA